MYIKPEANIWTGRLDPSGEEDTYLWHQVVETLDLDASIPKANGSSFALLGFESDEGVKRNLGRIGAAKGPDVIRKALCNLAVHFNSNELTLHDAGNVRVIDGDLEEAQAILADKVALLIKSGYFPILLGGGHEITYGHYCGIHEAIKETNKREIGVINFDAHFDIRSYDSGAHSGSSFRQIADDCDVRGENFHYLPIGINESSNNRALFKVMQSLGQHYILLGALQLGIDEVVKSQINKFISRVDHLYVTLDLDVMSMGFAPGVSAPAPFGVLPQVIREILLETLRSGKVISLDIAELNLTYDDGRTAKLAAQFIYEVVMGKI
ncbi:MAG: formiminoglutamase [Marinoscillum sp.]|jgi:formiminoglutamase